MTVDVIADDFQTQLEQGVALQGERRHAEAIAPLERAQRARPYDPRPFVHAALSHLALGRADAALAAADAACALAPLLAQAHSARGQALLALREHAQAEQAFAAALRQAPRSADLWVLCGAARYRQGLVEGAVAAMREALRHDPEHGVAKDNLAVLLRAGGANPSHAVAGEEGARPAIAGKVRVASEAPDLREAGLTAWRPKDASACLGLAVEFLSKMPAFAKLPFGEWSQVLFYQVARGHCFFVVDQDQRVRGFLGWALSDRDLAEQWVEGRAGLRSDQCVDGECVIINAFAAETDEARRFVMEVMRGLFASRRMLYFKRHYADGRTRAARLSVDTCVGDRLARSMGRREGYERAQGKAEERI